MSKKIAFEHSTKCWIYDNDVKVRNHCHTNGKYRGSTHWEIVIPTAIKQQISHRISQLKKISFNN